MNRIVGASGFLIIAHPSMSNPLEFIIILSGVNPLTLGLGSYSTSLYFKITGFSGVE